MDPDEPYWRINSSFSPPPLRLWDCRLQSDSMQYGPHGAPRGSTSSPSSNSRGSRSIVGSDSYGKHHHSLSDGVLSYSGSPPDNMQLPQLTSPINKFNPGSVSHVSWYPQSSERQLAVNAAEASLGFASPSVFKASHLESTSKQHFSFNNCSFPSRRPHIPKAVYPLVFHNPVSDCEQIGKAENNRVGRATPIEDRLSPFNWPANRSTLDNKFQKTLSELQRSEASPDLSASSRREGFRWSNASSYELELDGERFDVAEHDHAGSLRSELGCMAGQKCAVCEKLLRQKSPWSSHRIMRCGDMPTIGVLWCSHVFHAECLEQVTPKSQSHDPPCPVCLRTLGSLEESVSQPLQMALRSLRRSRGVILSEDPEHDKALNNVKGMMRSNWPLAAPKRNDGSSSSMKDGLKRHFTFKGKGSRDSF